MENWKEVIFGIIQGSSNQPITLNEIYRILETNPCVTDHHRQPWKTGGQLRYECWAREYLSDLVKSGRIKRVARAQYSAK